ncbi:MAG TPA: TonB-dependent receptor [Chitinophagaceae bacterium]|nr:TonB-dependent receptor [Chitinophagaceae bacterium]
MRKFVAVCILIISSCLIIAQSPERGRITGKIIDEQQKPIEGATAELIRATDSSLVKVAISNKMGFVEFENIRFGSYVIRVTHINHQRSFSSMVAFSAESNTTTFTDITLIPSAKELQAVQVTGRKPFIQQMTDRIVVNVENSVVNAGSSAFDVLERSPGILIDVNDNISMRGKAGVIIMIDGKPSPMSGADLVNYLRSLPSNAIERIELITNPSSKYDAAGNAGIIDIRMKKDQRFGTNGSFTAGYGQGIYPKANTGINFNYRNKKVNLFGGYNYSYRMNLNHLLLDRNFYSNGQFTGQDLKDNYTKIPLYLNTLRFGVDFYPNKNTVYGFVVNSNLNSFKPYNNNNSVVIGSNKQALYTFNTQTRNDNSNKNIAANFNIKHTFDTTGREISADLDYAYFNTDNSSRVSTQYHNLDGTPMQPDYILDGLQDGNLNLATAKVDYVYPLTKKAKIETGFKTSFVNADNDARFFNMSNGSPVDDVNKTNHFYYDENINAAYFIFRKGYKKFDFQVGLRGENTNVKTRQVKGDIRWDSSYIQLFPSAYLNYSIKDDQGIGVSVSRRIDRPNYSQLNPFLFLIDVTTYATGNPSLLPQFTWAYELNYTIKNINFTLGYSHTKKNQNIVIARFREVFPNIPADDNVTVQIPVNLSSSDYFGLTVAAPLRIAKWWNLINNANVFYNHVNGNLGVTTLDKGRAVADIRTNNTFTFKKGWTAELSGNYNTGGQYGFMVTRSQWGVGAGVQKTFWQGKGQMRFNVTDIFWTNLPRATITYDNYIEIWRAYRETRVANLTFTYRFGSNKVLQARRRATGSEEERQRAQ